MVLTVLMEQNVEQVLIILFLKSGVLVALFQMTLVARLDVSTVLQAITVPTDQPLLCPALLEHIELLRMPLT